MEQIKRKRWAIICLIVIAVIIFFLCLRGCQAGTNSELAVPDMPEESKSLDFIPAEKNENTITIPAITGLNMVAGQLQQAVDFRNPDTNNCYFRISLYLSDDTLIYQSGYLAPSELIQEITLNQKLEKGLYLNCRMVFDCFALDEEKSPLNSGEIIIEINSR